MSKLFAFDTLESTSKTAKEMALTGAGHGTVVLAGTQTAGRGRQGRSFFSAAAGGIYMSMVLQPEILRLETSALVTIYAAVRVCEAIEALCGKSPGIKWVNDLMLDGKKVCGILAETITDGTARWVIVGIGVNFSIEAEAFPPELQSIAGAIYPDGCPAVSRDHLAAGIAERMLEHAETWEDVLLAYKKRMLLLGDMVTVRAPGEHYIARALDIGKDGRLLVQRKNGSVDALLSGEVRIKMQ